MATVTMTLDGMAPLQRALKTAPDQVALHAADAVQVSSFAIAQRARSLVPVRSGALKSSITVAARGTIGRVGIGRVDVAGGGKGRSPEVYWRFVEFGTRYHPARPFFRPAAAAEESDYVARIKAIGPKLERDLATSRTL